MAAMANVDKQIGSQAFNNKDPNFVPKYKQVPYPPDL
jgi:hypothetical protein